MAKKPQPIEHFARSLEALETGLCQCDQGNNSGLRNAFESAKKNLLAGVDALKEQSLADAEVFTMIAAYANLRGIDYEKANEVAKDIQSH